MNVGVSSAILGSVVSLTVAIVILFRRRRRRLFFLFSSLSFGLFLWHAASVAMPYIKTPIAQLQTGAALLIPPVALAFFRELVRDESALRRNLVRLFVPASVALFAIVFTPFGRTLLFRILAAVYVLAALAIVLQCLWNAMNAAKSDPEKRRLRYLFYGGTVAMTLASTEILPAGESIVALGHVSTTLYLYFLYQSIVARRVIDVVEFMGKAAVVAVLTLVLATLYSVLLVWVGQDQPYLWLFNTVVASFVILIIYDPIRPYVEEMTAKVLFRDRYALRRLLQELLLRLRRSLTLEVMTERVIEAFERSGRAPQVALYLADEEGLQFRRLDFRGAEPPELLSLTDHPVLLQQLRRSPRPALLEQLTEHYQELPTQLTGGDATVQREIERTGEAIATLRTLNANVVLPMVVGDHVLGILAVGSENLAETYSTEEVALMMSVAESCAVVIEGSRAYEKRQERDRLVVLGEMAAGMAHEIRNPLGAIKGAAQVLESDGQSEENNEFIAVIVEEVDRLNGVLSQFLEYARPYSGAPQPTRVNDVVSNTTRVLSVHAIPESIQIQLDLAHDLPPIAVDPEQLKQVVLNIVLNAVQVMPDGGTIRLSTSLAGSSRGSAERNDEGAQVLIKVQDSGPGIPREDLPRVFVPFFTTKPSGTGLGLAISQRIVENWGGRIEVQSTQRQGATFILRFPALSGRRDTTQENALHAS